MAELEPTAQSTALVPSSAFGVFPGLPEYLKSHQLVTSTKVFNMKLSPPWQAPSLTGKFMETHGFEIDEAFKFYLLS